MSDLINQSMNHEAVYRTAPATPGLLKTFLVFKQLSGQSSTLFLFPIVDKILQTMLVVTTAAVQHFRT